MELSHLKQKWTYYANDDFKVTFTVCYGLLFMSTKTMYFKTKPMFSSLISYHRQLEG